MLVAVALAAALSASQKPTVALAVQETTKEQAQLAIRALKSQLSDVPIDLEIFWVSELGEDLPAQIRKAREATKRVHPQTVFWYQVTRERELLLYLAEPNGSRVLVRQVLQPEGAGRHEAAAIIVRASPRALLNGLPIGVQLQEAPVIEKPIPMFAPRPQPRARLTVGYAAQSAAADAPVLHGIDL